LDFATLLAWAFAAVYAIIVAGWWARHVLISLTRPLALYVSPADPLHVAARVSVVVPARNEAERVGECVRSLLRQGPVLQEVIVVDDRSADDTADVVFAAAQGDPRVRVLRVGALPDGWAGKAYACQRGGESAAAEWLLFADADCRFQTGGVAGAVQYAELHKVDLLSLWIAADHRSFWEHILIPLCGALILYWFPPLAANHAATNVAYANGQFILIRREAYLRIGGHACSRETVIEDIPLAQHAKRAGLRLRTALGPEIVAVRMYENFREIYDGWTRIFIGALQTQWKLLVSVVSLFGGSMVPSVGAPMAAVLVALYGWPEPMAFRVICVLLWLHVVAVYSVSFRLWALCLCRRRYLWLYPLSVAVVTAILVRAWWWMVTRRPIIWRGTPTGHRTMENA
jgi:cellulose synthase/poly-beta-1,6-N-acetylglucosamine synthase-like glycosyltransferase